MMTNDTEKLLDETGWELLCALQENARMSFADLGQARGADAASGGRPHPAAGGGGDHHGLSRGGESGEARPGAHGDHPLQGGERDLRAHHARHRWMP